MDSTIDRSRKPSRDRRRGAGLLLILLLGFMTSMLVWGIARPAVPGAPDRRAAEAREGARGGPGGQPMFGFEVRTGEELVSDGSGGRSTRIRADAVARVLNIAVVTALAVIWFRWNRR